jgi:hypothetical protein
MLLAPQGVVSGWDKRDSSGMVVWNDLFTVRRRDIYVLDDRHYEADEHYCPLPKVGWAAMR